jgi:hypothetical protein
MDEVIDGPSRHKTFTSSKKKVVAVLARGLSALNSAVHLLTAISVSNGW